MSISKIQFINKLLNILLPMIIAVEYLSSVFRNISFLCNIIAVIAILFLYLSFLFNNNIHWKDLIVTILSGLLIAFSGDISYISLLCVYVLFSVRHFFSKHLIKRCLYVSVICMGTIMIAYFFGFNRQYDTEIYRPIIDKTVARMSFGFVHPNQFTIFLLLITILFYMCTYSLKAYTLITIIDFILFQCTQSRTMMYVTLFLYFMLLLIRLLKPKELKKAYIIPCLFILFIVFSIVLSLFCSNSWIDTILTGRLALNKKYLEQGITLFGNPYLDSKPFDNSYIHMLVTKGVVYFVSYCFIVIFNFYKSQFKWKNAVLMLVIFMEAFMEVIFLKFGFMIIMPMLCMYGAKESNDTQNNTLLLVWKKSKV